MICGRLVVAVVTAVSIAGCAPTYVGTVSTDGPLVERTVFGELGEAKRVGVAPLSFVGVKFRNGDREITEEQAFEGKGEKKRASWEEDKKAMVEIFAQVTGTTEQPFVMAQVSSVDAATGLDYVLVPQAVLVDPGYFATYLFNAEALLVVRYDLIRLSDNRSVLQWTDREESSAGAASGTRLRNASRRLGLGAFLTLRAVAGAPPGETSSAKPGQEDK